MAVPITAQSTTTPAKVVIERRVRPGADAAFTDWVERLTGSASRASGHEGTSVLSAANGVRFILLRFASHADLDAWQATFEYAFLMREANATSQAGDVAQVRSGFETWFTLPDLPVPAAPPPKWKMALLTWLCLLPMVIALCIPAGAAAPAVPCQRRALDRHPGLDADVGADAATHAGVVFLALPREIEMPRAVMNADEILQRAKPLTHQTAHEFQPFGHIVKLPIALSERACTQGVENLNQLLADTMTLRDLYKKHHWQVSGPTFHQLHLLFDKHYEQQGELVDLVAERIRVLGGVGLAMAPDIAETTIIPRPPRGREEVPVQISRLLHAHEIVIKEARTMARQAAESGDDGTNDLIVSNIIRTNELQVWFVAEHIVDVPLVHAD